MPFTDRRRPGITPNNMAASDVAQRLTEHIVKIEQQKQVATFRVQGVQAILYNRLTQGLTCACKSHDRQIQDRVPTGDGSRPDVGASNRATTGQATFGIGDYSSPDDEFDDPNFHDQATSPNDPLAQWLGDQVRPGAPGGATTLEIGVPTLGDGGQYSPDLDALLSSIDLGSIGISDISCPICFGSGYVGGYSPFRAWRKVVSSLEVVSSSTFDTTTDGLALRPGTHSFNVVLPRGACLLDVFRTMNGALVTNAQVSIDGNDVKNKPLLPFFDGQLHTISFVTDQPFTHFEMQAALSKEPIYFEFPKKGRNSDISLLEKTDPFQIIVSPEVPQIDTLDVIAESQEGKLLVVQNVNNWQTRKNQHLGWEVTVRVCQPAELFRILPSRRYVTGQQTVNPVRIGQVNNQSGFGPDTKGQGQRFSF